MCVQGVEDLAARLIAHEIAHTHSIRALSLDRNYIGPAGKRALAAALETNVSLAYFSCADQHPAEKTPHKERKEVVARAEKAAEEAFVRAKRASFRYRQAIAVFARGAGTHLGPLPVRVVLEHLLGPGPQVRWPAWM